MSTGKIIIFESQLNQFKKRRRKGGVKEQHKSRIKKALAK
jgi:hypothetical protein